MVKAMSRKVVQSWRWLFVLCLLVAYPLAASAEKINWVDEHYDFTRVKKAIVYDVVVVDKSEMNSLIMWQAVHSRRHLPMSSNFGTVVLSKTIRK